jgi:hypothetical protein
MAKLTHTAPPARDFAASERRALLRKGIAIVGTQHVAGPFGGDVAYALNDNGTHRLRRRVEVIALVRDLTDSEARILAAYAA